MRFWRTPLDQKKFITPKGNVFVIVERCKGCAFCVEYCPREVLRISDSYNKKGYHYPEVIKEGVCVDCTLCESICPEFAIYSNRVEEPAPSPETASKSNAGTEQETT